jgi:hypothetical protein
MSTESTALDTAAKNTTADTTALSPELIASLEATVPGLIAQLNKRINIDQFKVDAGKIRDLDIQKIVLGTATIENIVLSNTNAKLLGASAFMQNVRTILELRFTLVWEVDLGWLGSWGDTEHLGSLDFGLSLGNVSVPSLANINMHIPHINIPNASANFQPINNLDLGGATFSKLTASGTQAPAGGFGLSGIGIGSAVMENITIPKTATNSVTLEEFKPNADIVLPGAEATNLNIPSAKVGNISTGGFALSAIASRRCLGADLGILAVRICVTPVVHMSVGSMLINDAELSATAAKLNINNIRVPVTVRGIAMSNLELEKIKINKITLS